MRYLLYLCFICLVSCKAQKETKVNANETLGLELVDSDAHSGIETYEAAVISDAKSLKKFYSRINKTRKPGLPVPMVDFTQNVLVVMCLGEQKGEIAPKLAKTEKEDEIVITVDVSDSKDSRNKENSLVSFPFYIYKLPLTTKNVTIQKSDF